MDRKRTIGFEVRALNNMIKRDIEKSEVFNLECFTGVHGWAVGYFYENRDRDVFQRDFEAKFSIRRSTATNILQRMEKNGLITRVSVDYDARLKKILLTNRAVEIHKMIINDFENREKRMAKGMDAAELETFFNIINKIQRNLEENNA